MQPPVSPLSSQSPFTQITSSHQDSSEPERYRGRFAPSPSGPLHFGSLVTALAGYLRAKSQRGVWLLRIDDIDPPRQPEGAVDSILRCLEAHHLHWDGSVYYQSQQAQRYHQILDWLQQQGLSYACQCTRKTIKASGGRYLGTCRDLNLPTPDHAIRLNNKQGYPQFQDNLLGAISIPQDVASEDFVIHRKDGLFAYHLASVVDDIHLGISEIVRGADLLYPSACQLSLYHTLGVTAPQYLHLPLAVTANGLKLSKQNHAPALQVSAAGPNLLAAMAFLGLAPPAELQGATVATILDWGLENWQLRKVPKLTEQCLSASTTG